MQTLIMILKLIPSIIATIKAMEEFVPLPQQGKMKLDCILSIITDVYGDAKTLVPEITKVINNLVKLANATGVFQK